MNPSTETWSNMEIGAQLRDKNIRAAIKHLKTALKIDAQLSLIDFEDELVWTIDQELLISQSLKSLESVNTEISCAPVDMSLWHKESPAKEVFQVATAMGLAKPPNRFVAIRAMRDRIREWGVEIV